MNATSKNGDIYSGENYTENGATWYLYKDTNGNLYESKEVPAYRIRMDNSQLTTDATGHPCIAPMR